MVLTGDSSGPLASALVTARYIVNLDSVSYPEGIKSPAADLNRDAKYGKFRYDRDFLLQFVGVCKEPPVDLPDLDALGINKPNGGPSQILSMSRGGSGAAPPSRQASVGLGFSASGFGKPGGQNPFNSIGNFSSASKLSSDERFNLANASCCVSVSGAPIPFGRPSQMQWTASQRGFGGTPMSSNRTRSKRGEKRGDGNNADGGQQHGFGHGQSSMGQTMSLEPVASLRASANRWDRKTVGNVDPESPEIVDRKVKGLLNKLTMAKFDSISDQIIAWANRSEKEKDGRTLNQVIRLVFEKATDEAMWSEMYARLCRKMMERISSQVQDDSIKNAEGKPITGGQLVRKYLLNRCQEDFERGWVAREATAAAAATTATEMQAAKAAYDKNRVDGEEEVVFHSDEYYAAQKAKRQGLGLIKFLGELFKLQMITERIMHECVKKLLLDPVEEEEIESLCQLLTTVGALLDTPKARAHMNVYFERMKELTEDRYGILLIRIRICVRVRFMLQDVLELRERKWVGRIGVAPPPHRLHRNKISLSVMTEMAKAMKKIAEDLDEFFAFRNLDEAGVYFTSLPAVYHHILINKATFRAIESKDADAQLLAQFFTHALAIGSCSLDAFEQGLSPVLEVIDDIVIDAPKAFSLFATIVKSVGLDEQWMTRLGDHEKLLRHFAVGPTAPVAVTQIRQPALPEAPGARNTHEDGLSSSSPEIAMQVEADRQFTQQTIGRRTAEKLIALFEDVIQYKRLLAHRGSDAQRLLDSFQWILDLPALDKGFKRRLIVATQRLSRASGLYPTCYILKDVQSEGDYPLAAGSFADIYKGTFKGRAVCMKVIRIYQTSQLDYFLKLCSKETILWEQLSHQNLLPLYGLYRSQSRLGLCLVSPWMENGDINMYLKNNPSADRNLLALDIAHGLLYLHENEIIHGDLKGPNILVDQLGRACLADFGLSSVSDANILAWTSHSSAGSKGGSLRWQAPELFDLENDEIVQNTTASDVYAWSCVCYEIFTGNVPFSHVKLDPTVMLLIKTGVQPTRPLDSSPCWGMWGLTIDIWQLMQDCWHASPNNRPTVDLIIAGLASTLHVDDRPTADDDTSFPRLFRRKMSDISENLHMATLEQLLGSGLDSDSSKSHIVV
ncbi:armadillo-type protein [Lyophyllum atratum]|nr:armadillo-type protein [Lyophyllum atratum]